MGFYQSVLKRSKKEAWGFWSAYRNLTSLAAPLVVVLLKGLLKGWPSVVQDIRETIFLAVGSYLVLWILTWAVSFPRAARLLSLEKDMRIAQLEQENSVIHASHPAFCGTLDNFVSISAIGRFSSDDIEHIPIDLQLFLKASLVNTGTIPTTVQSWRLSVAVDGRIIKSLTPSLPILEQFVFCRKSQTLEWEGQQDIEVPETPTMRLDQLAATHAAKQNQHLAGWLCFMVENVDEETIRDKATLTLRLTDAIGSVHTIERQPGQPWQDCYVLRDRSRATDRWRLEQ